MKLSECTKCPLLVGSRTQIIRGTGTGSNGIMIIGEAPGKDEDKGGEPFIGDSGKWVNKFLKYLDVERSECYITNIVKCLPLFPTQIRKPKVRKPTFQEIMECKTWLNKEIKKLKPKIIITFGGTALECLTELKYIMRHHGRAVKIKQYDCYVFPMLHPATLLYNYNESMPLIKEDLKKLKGFLQWLKK